MLSGGGGKLRRAGSRGWVCGFGVKGDKSYRPVNTGLRPVVRGRWQAGEVTFPLRSGGRGAWVLGLCGS
jgi:hypothetical protein